MLEYKNLKSKYQNFKEPVVVVTVSGKDISKDKENKFTLSNIVVELTSGFEASIAEFTIYDVYDSVSHTFLYEEVKKYILIGSPVIIAMGYGKKATEVFRGFISQVNFVYRLEETPGIEVHAMDIKGIMMANCYVKQVKSYWYSYTVKKILEQNFYQVLKGEKSVFNEINITDTPDKIEDQKGEEAERVTDKTQEMVYESDYEFVVKAAKKFNYEFFQLGDTIYFRKAKSDTQALMNIGPETGMIAFEIGYDLTGQVGKIEVRNSNPEKGELITTAKKFQNKMSNGNKAKKLISKQSKVYVDPSVSSKEEAEYRLNYLAEKMSYRFGTLETDLIGIPEIVPGKFINVQGLGTAASNSFYVETVKHTMYGNSFFQTHVSGVSAQLPQ